MDETQDLPDIRHESATSFKDIEAIIQHQTAAYDPQDVLILFDVDMVILKFYSHAFYTHTIAAYKDAYLSIVKGFDRTALIDFYIWHSVTRGMLLLDPDAPDVIRSIQSQYPCLALTGMRTGPFGAISSLEDWRYHNLKENGISFDRDPNHQMRYIFDDIPVFKGQKPLFHYGILMTNGLPRHTIKAEIMDHFFKRARSVPKLIILVDDVSTNLDAMATYLGHNHDGSDFVGIDFDPQLLLGDMTMSEKEFCTTWLSVIEESSACFSS